MAWQTTRPSLLVRLRNPADDASWAEFDRRYGELILRYGLHKGLQLADAEDVRQEVLVSLSRAMRSFEYSPERGRFRSYLGRVVHNAVTRNATRPYRRRECLLEDERLMVDRADSRDPDEVWEREWVNHHLRLAMQVIRRTFDPRTIEAFDGFLAGDSTELVARKTGLSHAAANKAKQRIRNRIRELIAAQLADEEEAH